MPVLGPGAVFVDVDQPLKPDFPDAGGHAAGFHRITIGDRVFPFDPGIAADAFFGDPRFPSEHGFLVRAAFDAFAVAAATLLIDQDDPVFRPLVDGTPGADDMPTELLISTTADGAETPTTRMTFTPTTNIIITADLNPEADGTRDLGTQTTAQWANVWSDLINGADYGYENGWRSLEADTYDGYGPGIAFDFGSHFENGKALGITRVKVGAEEKVIGYADGKPVTETVDVFDRQRVTDVAQVPKFALTEDFVEFHGRRFTLAQLDALLALV